MAAASAEGEEYAVLWSRLAPDIHTLQSSSDRGARRAALTQLKAALLDAAPSSSSSPPSTALLMRLFTERLQAPLLAVVGGDPVEKCRELGAGLLLAFLKHPTLLPPEQDGGDDALEPRAAAPASSILAAYLPVVRHRLGGPAGGEGTAEPSEEVRLLLLRTLNVLLARPGCCPPTLRRPLREEGRDGACFADLAAVLARALSDAYPEAKQEACAALGYAARYAPGQLRLYQATLLKPLLGNLAHQHARIRALALQALGQLLALGNDAMARVMEEEVVPVLSRLVFDRTPSVRLALARMVGTWLCQQGAGAAAAESTQEGEGAEHEEGHASASAYHFEASEPQLLLLLLLVLSDETASDVAAEARTIAQAAGRAWVARRKARDEQRRFAHLRAEGWSSSSEETDGAELEKEDGALRCMVRSLLLESLLPRALEDVGHWTLRVRHRAILLLATLISLGGPEPVTAALPRVVRTLLSTLVADGVEAEVDAAVGQAARALGRTVRLGALLDELLPKVRGERGAQTLHRAAALRLLHAALDEVVATGRCGLTGVEAATLARSLAHPAVLTGDNDDEEGTIAPATAGSLADCLAAAVRVAAADHCGGSSSSSSACRVDFLRAALPLLSLPADSTARRRALEALDYLAAALAVEEGEEEEDEGPSPVPDARRRAALLRRHFPALLDKDTAASSWGSVRSPGRVALDALLRECPEGAFEHWAAVVAPVLSRQLQPPPTTAHAGGKGAGGDEEGRRVELRLAHLLLLDSLLRDPSADTQGHPAVLRGIVSTMLQPNLVWRAGRAEATVRKAALVALHALLGVLRRRRSAAGSEEALLGLAARLALFAPLRTALEEYDATARELATLCLEGVFSTSSAAEEAQQEEEAEVGRRVLPELVKRLDDPSMDVRRAACKALEALFSRHSSLAAGGPHADAVDAALRQLAIHLADPQIEEGVARVLAAAKTGKQ